jgi:multidrug efflux pump subunit AcrA (membrane-fusion protein)
MNKKIIIPIMLVITFALAISACGTPASTPVNQPTPIPPGAVIAEGHIRPVQAVMLSFQGRGEVKEILVKQGDRVKQGDVLAKLSDADQARAQLVAAQQAYDLLLRDASGDRAKAWQAYMSAQKARADALHKWDTLDVKDIESRMKDQQTIVDERQKDLQDAQAEFDQYKEQPENNFYRRNAADKLQSAQENLDEAIKKVESITRERDTIRAELDAALGAEVEAKYQYELTSDGPNKDQLKLAQAQLDAAQATLDNFELKAPFDGVVADVSLHVGDQVGPETPAISVADFDQWIVETDDVTELEVVKLAVGEKVTMIPDALSDVQLEGTVESISQSFTKQGGDILYTVRIKVDKVDPRLRWGMTVEVTFPPLQK